MARTQLLIVLSVLLVATGLGPCSPPAVVPEVTLESCGPLVSDPAVLDPAVLSTESASGESVDLLGFVLEAVATARARDTRCGSPSDHQRVCRALWVTHQLDPLPLVLVGQPLGAEHAEALRWALEDGAAATKGELSAAFLELSQATAALSTEVLSERELATIVLDRASPSILEPLRDAEARC